MLLVATANPFRFALQHNLSAGPGPQMGHLHTGSPISARHTPFAARPTMRNFAGEVIR